MRSLLQSFGRLCVAPAPSPFTLTAAGQLTQARFKAMFPRKVKYRRVHKGRVPIALGGSTKGTTLTVGDFGLRAIQPCRLTSKQLEMVENALKRSLKPFRGSKILFRVFPDIPVCIKGNETRMGKGKGTFEYWMCRAPVGKMILEIYGPNLRPEIAKAALKVVADKLPTITEIVDRHGEGRIGNKTVEVEKRLPKVYSRKEVLEMSQE